MNIIEAIQKRQSVRSFTKQKVTSEIIKEILNISKFAPSGGNTQPWKVYVLNEKIIEKLEVAVMHNLCLLYTSPSPRDNTTSRMPSSA